MALAAPGSDAWALAPLADPGTGEGVSAVVVVALSAPGANVGTPAALADPDIGVGVSAVIPVAPDPYVGVLGAPDAYIGVLGAPDMYAGVLVLFIVFWLGFDPLLSLTMFLCSRRHVQIC